MFRAIHEACKDVFCRKDHRKELEGRNVFAEALAEKWYPVFEQFREWYPTEQAQQTAWVMKIGE